MLTSSQVSFVDRSLVDLWDVDLIALRVLQIVSVSQSFTQAAARLGVTQQAVSARIARLEARIGKPLVHRDRRGARLTEMGELVVGWSARLLSEAENFASELGSPDDTRSMLAIAASLTIAEFLLPGWIAALPDPPVVRIAAMNSALVAEQLRDGHAQLGFIETPNIPSDLASLPVGHDELVLVVPPQHRWAAHRHPITPSELARTPLIVRERGSGTRKVLERALEVLPESLSLAPPALELPTTGAIRSALTRRGSPPTVISRRAVCGELASGRLVVVPVESLDLSRPITALWCKGERPLASTQRLLQVARTTPLG